MRWALALAIAIYASSCGVAPAQFDFAVPAPQIDVPSFPQQLPRLPDVAPNQIPAEGAPVPLPPNIPDLGSNPLSYCNLYGSSDPRCPLATLGAPATASTADPTAAPPPDRVAIYNEQPVALSLLLISGGNVESIAVEANGVATRTFDPATKLEARIASGDRELAFSLVTGVDYAIKPFNGSYFVVPVR
jgi:hypothetical protein